MTLPPPIRDFDPCGFIDPNTGRAYAFARENTTPEFGTSPRTLVSRLCAPQDLCGYEFDDIPSRLRVSVLGHFMCNGVWELPAPGFTDGSYLPYRRHISGEFAGDYSMFRVNDPTLLPYPPAPGATGFTARYAAPEWTVWTAVESALLLSPGVWDLSNVGYTGYRFRAAIDVTFTRPSSTGPWTVFYIAIGAYAQYTDHCTTFNAQGLCLGNYPGPGGVAWPDWQGAGWGAWWISGLDFCEPADDGNFLRIDNTGFPVPSDCEAPGSIDPIQWVNAGGGGYFLVFRERQA